MYASPKAAASEKILRSDVDLFGWKKSFHQNKKYTYIFIYKKYLSLFIFSGKKYFELIERMSEAIE